VFEGKEKARERKRRVVEFEGASVI